MTSVNIGTKSPKTKTYEGAKARAFPPLEELKRTLFSCFLWERTFYEGGDDAATRLAELVPKVEPQKLADAVVEARQKRKIRHAPLFLISEMTKHKGTKPLVRALCSKVIQRPDDATELVALYWKDGVKALPSSLKKGIADSLSGFSDFQLAKYQNRGSKVKLVDLFNLTHPYPRSEVQANTWKLFMKEGLPTPVTWETRLSAEGNTKETWTKLLAEKAVGSFAFVRNLRNMREAGIERSVIRDHLAKIDAVDLLPTVLIAAANTNPDLESDIQDLFYRSFTSKKKIPGETTLLVDVSGSMDHKLSDRSDISRMDAACGVAMILREVCEDLVIKSFSTGLATVPDRRGFALKQAIISSQSHGGTNLGAALREAAMRPIERLIVVTDEQATDEVPSVKGSGAYMINVGSYKNGISFGDWVRVNGFSDAVIDFIADLETKQEDSDGTQTVS